VKRFASLVGCTVLGTIGWWAGARVGIFTAVVIGGIASGVGWWVGGRVSEEFLP